MKDRFVCVAMVVLGVVLVVVSGVAGYLISQRPSPESADPSIPEPAHLPRLEDLCVFVSPSGLCGRSDGDIVDRKDELARTQGRLERLEELHSNHVGFLRCTTNYWRTHYERGTKPGDLPPIGCASPPPPAISTRHLPATRSTVTTPLSYLVPAEQFRIMRICDRAITDKELEELEESTK